MYNYDFKKLDEKIVYEKTDGLVEVNGSTYNFSIVVTNKNLLLFTDTSKNNPLSGRGVYLPSDYLLKLRIPLEKLDYKVDDVNTIINYENNEIILYDVSISEYL